MGRKKFGKTKRIGRVEERNESAWYGRRIKQLHTEEY